MEDNSIERRDKVIHRLNFLKNEMLKFFNCEDKNLDISKVYFTNKHFSASISYRYINLEKSDSRKIITSTYYFDIEGEYIEREGIWYEGKFYSYDNLSPFFEVISREIQAYSN